MKREQLQAIQIDHQVAYRLVSTKLPPIHLFDDVADEAEFDALYDVQALTNPRLLNEAGNLNLVPRDEIPFGIPGCSAAVAPFTHVHPDGSRFSSGDFGVLYLADSKEAALDEVTYHQQRYLSGISGLAYDRLVFRCYLAEFGGCGLVDLTSIEDVHDPDDYSASQATGVQLRREHAAGIRYRSVRSPGHLCWGLFSPRYVRAMNQGPTYELVWDGNRISFRGRVQSTP